MVGQEELTHAYSDIHPYTSVVQEVSQTLRETVTTDDVTWDQLDSVGHNPRYTTVMETLASTNAEEFPQMPLLGFRRLDTFVDSLADQLGSILTETVVGISNSTCDKAQMKAFTELMVDSTVSGNEHYNHLYQMISYQNDPHEVVRLFQLAEIILPISSRKDPTDPQSVFTVSATKLEENIGKISALLAAPGK